MMKSEDEIRGQIVDAEESNLFGMSYEDGVKAALEWVIGDVDEPPVEPISEE